MTKEEKREYARKRYQANREKILEQQKQYRKENAEYYKEYYQANRERLKEYKKQYDKTPIGRANNLLTSYNQADRKANRGECSLTAKWIVENIFNKPCHYNCGESDWKKMGCDRIDNSKPHTMDNVVPCCEECNKKRGTMDYYEFIKKLGESPLP